MTQIQWTNRTWNPIRGCRRVSAGCSNCYAERQAARFSGSGQPYDGLVKLTSRGPVWSGEARFIPEKLTEPLSWRKPQMVFVNSMSDLFHEKLTNEQIAAVFGVMAASPQHTFQVLTKRPERMCEWFDWIRENAGPGIPWGGAECADELGIKTEWLGVEERSQAVWNARSWAEPAVGWRLDITAAHKAGWPLPNVWLGVSVEDQATADERIPLLLQTPAAVRWVSAEPLLGEVWLDVDWLMPRCEACGRHSTRGKCCEYEPHCTGGTEYSRQENTLLDWVVVGGESGPGARPCDVEWVRSIVSQCSEAQVPVFVKQLGANPHAWTPGKGDGWELDRKGGNPEEWPEDLRVREWPR